MMLSLNFRKPCTLKKLKHRIKVRKFVVLQRKTGVLLIVFLCETQYQLQFYICEGKNLFF